MKIWIFSVVVHALLLWALTLVLIPVPEKPASSAVIQTYSYTAVREKPISESQVAAAPVHYNDTAKPVVQSAEKRSSASRKASKSAKVSRSEQGVVSAEPVVNSQPMATAPAPAKQNSSLAERALAAVSANTSEPIRQRHDQSELVISSGSSVEGELAPAMLNTVKSYADGSELVKGVHGCWKIPPVESRTGATWMTTSTPCETDTTAEQINDILQKRRTYAND